ncbi:MAG: hypothetical protein OEV08_05615 [Nitrospira sp.]|nr:hypothetical protein [Nitrospira sp.]
MLIGAKDVRAEAIDAFVKTPRGGVAGGSIVKQGYRLIIVDKDGVLVSEYQLTEPALAQSEAFVAGIKQAIEAIEEDV